MKAMFTKMKRTLAMLLALAMLAGMLPGVARAAESTPDDGFMTTANVTDELSQEELARFFRENMNPAIVSEAELPDPEEIVRVIVELDEESLLERRQAEHMDAMPMDCFLSTSAAQEQLVDIHTAQTLVLNQMRESGISSQVTYSYSTITSGFAAKIAYKDLQTVAAMDGVKNVVISQLFYPDVVGKASLGKALTAAEIAAYANNTQYQGSGMVIGILDTGLDWNHEAFAQAPEVQRFTRDTMEQIAKYDITYDEAGNLTEVIAYSYAALWYAQANSGSELALLTADDLYKSPKVPFGFDYADGDADIIPSAAAVTNYGNDHGTHVAGIAAGKAVDAEGNVTFAGQSPEAQLAIFKVFSDGSSGASTDTLLAALNDAILLDVDVINMSLGSPAGFAEEEAGSAVQVYYDTVKAAGILLNCSAGNTYSSSMGGPQSDYPHAADPDSGVISSPSSYDAALSVASVNASETKTFGVGQELVPFNDVSGYDFAAQLLGDKTEATFPYVMVPGFGTPEDYEGINAEGKIAVVIRGSLSFNDKQLNAANAGAIGCIIYNNKDGYLLNMAVDNYKIPTVSISYVNGRMMENQQDKTLTLTTAGGMVSMSDFSSWGPLPNLELKPEITAPGGDIYSSLPFAQYGYMSGTSMASPYLAGISAAAMEYVTKLYPAMADADKRAMVNQLLMSTADVLYDDKGVPFSPRRQGAGMVDLAAAVNTPAFLYVKDSDKAKIELGHDPNKVGKYDLSFRVKNLDAFDVSYDVKTMVQTETISADGQFILQAGHLLEAAAEIAITGGTLEGSTITVPARGEATVVVSLTLSESARNYLDAFENGIYVEGFVELTNADDPALSLPFLGFYGDWTQAPIFEEADYYNGLPVKRFATVPTGVYAMMYVFPLGTYPFVMPEGYTEPAPSKDLISLNLGSGNGISNLYYLQSGLLRGVKHADVQITDADTGELIHSASGLNTRKAYYNASAGTIRAGMVGDVWPALMSYSANVASGTRMNYEVTTWLDVEGAQKNARNTYSFPLTADSEFPWVVNRNELKFYYGEDGRVYLDLVLTDNFALAAATLYSATEGRDSYGRPTGGTSPGSNYYNGMTPVLKEDGSVYRNYEEATVTFDVTDFYKELYQGVFYVLAYDWAMNECCLKISLDEIPVTEINLDTTEATLPIRGYVQLNATVTPDNATNQALTWTSSDTAVAEVRSGLVKAIAPGTATITVKADAYSDVFAVCNITVTEEMGPDVPMEDFILSRTGVSLYAGETNSLVRLTAYTPYTATNFDLTWSSSDEAVAAVDENGVITGVSAGTCVVTAKAVLGDAFKEVNVTVRELEHGTGSFSIDGDVLVGYSGTEETVTVPDGIRVIGDNAFKGNTYIKHVILPDSVQEIRYRAFYGCTNLETMAMPETIHALGEQSFYNCKKLTTFGLTEKGVIPGGMTEIPKGCFYNCNALQGELVIPDGVTTICQEAFYGLKAITSITMPNTVNSWGPEGAYAQFSGCSNVTSITLSENLTSLPRNCFFSCTSLTALPDLKNITELGNACFQHMDGAKEIVVPAQVTYMGNLCFAYCDVLEKVEILGDPDMGTDAFANAPMLTTVTGNFTTIGESMFEKCTGLVSFRMPDQVTYIGKNAFMSCTALESVVFPASYSASTLSMGVEPFKSCKAFTGMVIEDGCAAVKFVDGALYSGDGKKLICLPADFKETNYTVADGVEVIGSCVFYGNTALTGVTFPNSLKEIEEYAFYNCSKLTSIDLPDGVETVGQYAFYNCAAVKTLDLGKSLKAVTSNAFRGMKLVESIVLPDTVTTVADYAFKDCQNATTIIIPEGVVSIDKYAFETCKKVESLILPSTLKELGVRAFYNCNAVKEIDCGGLTMIPEYAFYGCKLAEKLTLSDEVTTVGPSAFYNCWALTLERWPSKLEKVEKYAFYMMRAQQNFDLSATRITTIGPSAFYQPYEARSIVFPNTLQTIDSKAFAYLNYNKPAYVTEIHIPSKVSYIAKDAFTYANGLQSITVDPANSVYTATNGILILLETGELYLWPMANTTTEFTVPANMTSIPSKMFQNNASLKKITIHSGVTYIGTYAFSGSDIEEFVFEPCATELVIDNSAFSNCELVTEMNLPYGTTLLGSSVFNGCDNLQKVNLPDTITEMGANTFAYCVKLSEVKLPARLSVMPNSAFSNCPSLEEITLPAAMNDCGMGRVTSPFSFCTSLKNIWVEEGSRSFKSVDGVLYSLDGKTLWIYPMARTETTYAIPEGTVRIGNRAFLNTAALESVSFPSTLVRVGDMALYMCNNLKDFYFNGMTAPVLETDLSSYGGYFNYAAYWNFVDKWMEVDNTTGKVIPNSLGLNLYYPENAQGYDAYVWEIYFQSGSTNVMDASYFTVTGLNVVEIDNRNALLTWDTVRKSGAESITYKVERSAATHIVTETQDTWLYHGFETLADGLTDTTYTDTTALDFGLHYAYRVSAYNADGDTGPAAIATLYIDADGENADELAALAVIKAIEALKPIDRLTLEDESRIQDVLSMYNALTEAQKALVSNYPDLLDALNLMDRLHAQVVMELIANLPNPEHIDQNDKAEVEAARKAYDALTESQKKLVENLQKLLDCEKALEDDHSQTEVRNAREATCEETGYTGDTYCLKCGMLLQKGQEIPALGHKTEIQGQKEATCTEAGFTGNEVCTVCGKLIQAGQVIEALGHTTEVVGQKEATCTEDGYTGDTVCTVCDEILEQGKEIAAPGHATEVVGQKNATCTEDGYTGDTICTVCQETLEQGEVIRAQGHSQELVGLKEATCTENGYTGDIVCNICGELLVLGEEVPALGHTTEIVGQKEATCTEDGYTGDTVCTVCGETVELGQVLPANCPAKQFGDLDVNQWYHEGICFVLKQGLMQGVDEEKAIFAPNATLTRAQMVTVLYRAAGEPAVEELSNPFSDVPADTWYTDAVIWAYHAGLVKGVDDTTFAPNATITREQMATILYRRAQADKVEEDHLARFTDGDRISDYAVEAMNWAVANGFITGMDETTLAPAATATRAQMATILMRVLTTIG